jgi:hypothetical protein
MGILGSKTDPAADLRKARQDLMDLRREHAQLQAERDTLRNQLDGKPDLMWWVQAKADRQRAALDLLNRRVLNQRFILRTLNELGRGLTTDEFITAKSQLDNEQVKNLIEVPAA